MYCSNIFEMVEDIIAWQEGLDTDANDDDDDA